MPHEKLFESISIPTMTFKNRIALAPMTRARAGTSRIPNELMAEYYCQRASAGLMITEATTISEQANGWNESPGIYSDEMMIGWQQVTKAVHEKEAKIFLQLWHCGRASHSDFHNGKLPVAASALAIQGDGVYTPLRGKQPYETPRALETKELPGIVYDYKLAAERAKEAGFDGIEIHSANGYLLDTFLQSKTNTRTDAYGGSIENRFRLLREIVEAVCEVWGDYRVAVRLSPNGVYNDMGSRDFREQVLFAAAQLDKYNLAYLHVMDGLGFGFHGLGEPVKLHEIKQVFSGLVMGNCGYTYEAAQSAIASQTADLISFGRPYISNPDLVERFQHKLPLAAEATMDTWYSPTGKLGYTDFPVYQA
jgi:2,4-dienoyl-CoA reductase-like NADH-dependent reductase (Old Yellow Enzyme family)